MSGIAERSGDWLLHGAAGGSLLLLLTAALMAWYRQPARRQLLGQVGLGAALLVAVLSLGPAWLPIPVPGEAPVVVAGTNEEIVPEVVLLDNVPVSDASQKRFLSDASEKRWDTERFSEASLTLSIWDALRLVYGAIALALLARCLLGHVALRRLLRTAALPPKAVNLAYAQVCRGRNRPRLLVSSRLRTPISCGLFRPTIVLPQAMCEPDQADRLPWVFAHELTHLRRRDAWASLLFSLGQAVFFYVPWFWWLRRQVRLCQEYLADAAAVRHAGGRADYAQFLLTLTQTPAVPLGAAGVLGNSSDLFRRITMLLHSPKHLERRCPRWWAVAACSGLTALAVVLAGVGLRAEAAVAPETPKETPKKPVPKAPPKDQGKPAAPEQKPRDPFQEIPDVLDRVPGLDNDQLGQIREEMRKAREEMRKALEQGQQFRGVFPGVLGQQGLFAPGSPGRLGARVEKPSDVLAEQLDLPKGQGLVIADVQADSAAARAGLKARDILLELNGKPVPDDVRVFLKQLDDLKADQSVDAVVLRRGKREAVKGIKLPEKQKAAQNLFGGGGQNPFNPAQPNFPNLQDFQFRGLPGGPLQGFGQGFGGGGQGVMVSSFRNNDGFTTRHQEGNLVITVTGKVDGNKATVSAIQVQDGGKTTKYDTLDKVPEQYRAKARNLVEMSEKPSIKVEVKDE